MNDTTLEIIALLTISMGLIIAFFFVFNYEPQDAFFVDEDDSNAFLHGKILRSTYSESSGWTYAEIQSCRKLDAFYEGELTLKSGDEITFSGQMYNGKFTIEEIN